MGIYSGRQRGLTLFVFPLTSAAIVFEPFFFLIFSFLSSSIRFLFFNIPTIYKKG